MTQPYSDLDPALLDECPDCDGTGIAGPDQGDRQGFPCRWCDGAGVSPWVAVEVADNEDSWVPR